MDAPSPTKFESREKSTGLKSGHLASHPPSATWATHFTPPHLGVSRGGCGAPSPGSTEPLVLLHAWAGQGGGPPRADLEPWPSLAVLSLSQPVSEGVWWKNQTSRCLYPDLGVELLCVSVEHPLTGPFSCSPPGWLPCWGTPSCWSKALPS